MVINYSLRAQQLLHIVFNVGHGTQAEFLVQHGQQVRRQEAWRCRAGHDVGHAQREQGQQDDNRFLLKPGEHQGERQIVDAAAQFFRQRDRQNNGRVSIVTLARIDQARQAFDVAEVQLVETVFTARQGQDQAIVRYAGGESGEVVTLTARAVAAADEEDVAQLFTADEIDQRICGSEQGFSAEADGLR